MLNKNPKNTPHPNKEFDIIYKSYIEYQLKKYDKL